MKTTRIIPAYDLLEAPFIKVEAMIRQPGATNGKPNIIKQTKYNVAPTAKKIATYIVNQIFGSDLVTQTEGLNINWLMPSLKKALKEAVYQTESFIYIHKYDNKIYLECIKKNEIFDLVQKYDKVKSCIIKQETFTEGNISYILERHIELKNGETYLQMKAFEKNSKGEVSQIPMNVFNARTNNEYIDKYVLPYECLINIDIGEYFFEDSKKELNEEINIINVIADEIEKTRTRIATSQHFQSGDIVGTWKPGSTHYEIQSLSVGQLQDYFTLLPGDKEHHIFEFLQGDIRTAEYVNTFKFYDQQIIQMAGLSPASFGYEKDNYMNVDNVNLSQNNSEMAIEALKTQIEPQINKLIENIVKAQASQSITINAIPNDLVWDYGSNERFDDIKKLQVLRQINTVASVPYKTRAKIITPILNKLIDSGYDEEEINKLIEAHNEEEKGISVEYGEI